MLTYKSQVHTEHNVHTHKRCTDKEAGVPNGGGLSDEMLDR